MEFFTGFLWLIECVVFFSLLLLLFYINTTGNFNKINYNFVKILTTGSIFGLVSIFTYFSLFSEFEYFIPNELNINFLWDDFYEAFNNNVMNDATSLLISYYFVNSFEFIILIIILLFGSVVCVNLNRCNKDFKLPKYNTLLSVFNFFKDWVDAVFIRKQNLTDQELNVSSTRTFNKKSKSV